MTVYITRKEWIHISKLGTFKTLRGAMRKATEFKIRYPYMFVWIGE